MKTKTNFKAGTTKTHTSTDGKVSLVCEYDPDGNLQYCDVKH